MIHGRCAFIISQVLHVHRVSTNFMTTVRQATIEDSEQISVNWIRGMEFHSDFNLIFQTAPDFKEKILTDIKELFSKTFVTFFVIELDGKIVGHCLTTINQRPKVFEKTTRGYIGETYIDEMLQGQGLGTQLISAVKKWFKDQNVDYVDLQVAIKNERGEKFWKSMGFKTVNYFMVNDLNT